MSTGLECQFIEPEPGKWYYILEDWSAPKMSWDWREYATAYGPFPSEDAGFVHLREHHANPGGYGIVSYGHYQPDEVYAALLKEARK